jgi:8-oxo-dGTP pyrophosphatase MutT (NUDIX family)
MKKKENAAFLAYRTGPEGREYFLQRRDKDAPGYPDCFDFFGGGLEVDETPEEAMYRETYEELEYHPEHASYFKAYEYGGYKLVHIFPEQVGPGFEDRVRVHEGEYGKFLTLAELEAMDTREVASSVLAPLRDLERELPR